MASSRPLIKRLLRGLRPAFLGPLRFALDSGYLRAALLCQAVDRSGAPLPWLTYPAIEYLGSLDWRGHRVLEWGAGNSTLWWAAQGAEVLAVEHNPGWYRELRTRLQSDGAGAGHIDLRLAAGEEYAELPRGLGPFDLVVIDGESRLRCAEVALAVTAPAGAIVLDNAEQPWAAPGQTGFPILDLLAGHGWQRVDFHGFAPGVARPHCTSLFFRAATALFDHSRPPRRLQGIVPG